MGVSQLLTHINNCYISIYSRYIYVYIYISIYSPKTAICGLVRPIKWTLYGMISNITPMKSALHAYNFYLGWSPVHLLFITQKNRKSTRAWPIFISNSTTFWFFFFRGWIINFFWKGAPGGPTPISFQSEYSSSNWFHSNTLNPSPLFNTNC